MNTQIIIRKSAAVIVSTLFLGLAQSGLCIAADQTDVPHVAVSYTGLDLASSQGAAKLLRRIQAAASTICDSELSADASVFRSLHMQRCEQGLVRKAVVQIGKPALSSVYQAQYHDLVPNQPVLAKAR